MFIEKSCFCGSFFFVIVLTSEFNADLWLVWEP